MGYGHDEVDYTATTGGDDDFEIGAVSAAGFDADKAEKENGFRDVPPGPQTLVVSGYQVLKEEHYSVMVDGRLSSFVSYPIIIRFHQAGDKRATITDYFILPPADPKQAEAYFRGVPKDKPDGVPGLQANKFFHLMDRMGCLDANKTLTPIGGKPANWKGRAVGAIIEKGRGTYLDKNKEPQPRSNQVKFFSYKAVPSATTVAGQPAGNQTVNPASYAPPAQPRSSANVDDVLANI